MVLLRWPPAALTNLWLLVLLHILIATCPADSAASWRPNATLSGAEEEAVYESYSHDPWGPARRVQGEAPARPRDKRGVVDLYNMLRCATGCDPLAFKGYGCYCGFLGSGYTVDGIDRCCKMHDWCYNAAECPMFLEYFVPYFWKCYHHRPICALDQEGLCAQRLCECDRQLAECLRRYPCPHTKAVCTSSPWRLLQNVFML